MNCFNFLCQLGYGMMLTTVTGTVMLLFWWLFQALLIKIKPASIYPLLKFSCLFFLVPVVYILISVYKVGGTYSENGLPIVSMGSKMVVIFGGGSLILIAAGLYGLCRFLWRYHQFKTEIKDNYAETDNLVMKQFTKIRRILKIKRPVGFFRNTAIKLPKFTGLVFPQVLLPDQAYIMREYEVLFMHELMHCKSGDMWNVMISNLIMVLYWFNPFVSKAMESVEQWREFNCDVHVCEHAYTTYTPKEYYHCILDIVERSKKQHGDEDCGFAVSLCGGESNFEWRVKTMNKHIEAKKYPKWLSIALVFAFVITSVPSACAAGMAAVKLERYLSEKMIKEDRVAEDEEEVEYILYPEEDDCKNVQVMDEPVCGATTYSSSSNTYEWNIPASSRYMTKSFKVTKNGRLAVTGLPKSSTITYRIGYVDEDSVIHFIEGTGNKNHTFTMDKSQWVQFFVQNRSTTKTLSITAGYTYVD